MLTELDRSPPLSLDDALTIGSTIAHVPSVLLGVDWRGMPVLHRVRIGDGGSPSLLLLGRWADDVLAAIRASVAAWYDGVTVSEWRPCSLYTPPSSMHDGRALTVNFLDVALIVTAHDNPHLTLCRGMSPSRVYARESAGGRGCWRYYPRQVPGWPPRDVGFYTLRGGR